MATYQAKVLTPWQNEPGRNDMLVALEYPASWTDITWQADELIGADKLNRLVGLGEHLTAGQVSALKADARFSVLPPVVEEGGVGQPPATLSPTEIETVKKEVAALLSLDVAKLVIKDTTAAETVVARVKEVVLYPPFTVGEHVVVGDIRYWKGNLYRILQSHTTQADWTPDVAKSLFTRYFEPSDDPWPWVRPTGAHDAYPKGARVLHKGTTWVSQIDANVWEPGSVGAEAFWLKEGVEPPITEPAWAAGVKYTGDNTAGAGKGDIVTYGGRRYRCWQTHTSQVGWEPPKVPALWIDLGPI